MRLWLLISLTLSCSEYTTESPPYLNILNPIDPFPLPNETNFLASLSGKAIL